MSETRLDTQTPTAGALIRRARESAGLHIAALAVLLKVPVRRLEALESDRYDLLPDTVFTRALASSVCRHLKVDGVEILRMLPEPLKPTFRPSINEPFRGARQAQGPSLLSQVSKPAVIAGSLLLVAALALLVLPYVQDFFKEGASGAASPAPTGAEAAPKTSESASSADTVVSEQVMRPVSEPSPVASGTLPATAAPEVVSASLPAAVMATAAAPAGAAGTVMFFAKGESWVEVVDAKGTTVLRKLLRPGEAASAEGALPLSVVVGRADALQVQVRGRAFDLLAIARDNVARFEVK
ncbi:MAG: RodZ domain-containing protein [Pseudomonadota bacterium]